MVREGLSEDGRPEFPMGRVPPSMAEVGTKGLGVSEGPEKARVPGEQRTRGRVARGEVAEEGRL